MRQNPSRKLSLLIVLFLIGSLVSQAASPLIVRAASTHPKNLWTGKLVLEATQYPTSKKVCQNTAIDLGVKVTNENIMTPVAGAQVTVTDKNGGKVIHNTWDNGTANFKEVMDQIGENKITITASKVGYSNDSFSLTYEVVYCTWKVRVYTTENRTIADYEDLDATAESDWTTVLKIDTSQANGKDITIDSGMVTGQFKVDMLEKILGPLLVSLEPEVDNQFEREVTATITGNEMKLKFNTYPFSTPNAMKIALFDAVAKQPVSFKPPVPILPYFGQCLELNNMTEVSFALSGGLKLISSGKSCFFEPPVFGLYIAILVEPIKG